MAIFDGQTWSLQPLAIDADFPAKLQCLFEFKQGLRYKILYGGRGAGRSWGVARALLLLGTQKSLRVLCAREFQNSISDSVHKLLSDQIEALGLSGFYTILQSRIEGKNGTYFAFEGIKNNVSRIKSYEGIDICWVEEANKTSKNSWGVLIPTVRKPGSEIWMTFNPELDTDYTYRRFVIEQDDSMICQYMTYRDNPWFPEVLRAEMERDKARDYDYYLNVWEGNCLQQLEGAVYAKELRKATEEKRICPVPWEKSVPVDTYWDLGRADRTAIWFVQKVGFQWRIIDYLEDTGEDIGFFLKALQRKNYLYGTLNLPHDAKAKRLGMKYTVEEICRNSGFTVRIVPKVSVTDGINAARMILGNCWFDQKNTETGVQRLRHYRFRVVDGHLSNEPLHDDASDGADAFRYFALGSQRGGDNGRVRIRERLEAAAEAFVAGRKETAEGSGRPSGGTGLHWLS